MRIQIMEEIKMIGNLLRGIFSSLTMVQYPGHRTSNHPMQYQQWNQSIWQFRMHLEKRLIITVLFGSRYFYILSSPPPKRQPICSGTHRRCSKLSAGQTHRYSLSFYRGCNCERSSYCTADQPADESSRSSTSHTVCGWNGSSGYVNSLSVRSQLRRTDNFGRC